jgi:hypothetical protein
MIKYSLIFSISLSFLFLRHFLFYRIMHCFEPLSYPVLQDTVCPIMFC